jgi:hypothetical protein
MLTLASRGSVWVDGLDLQVSGNVYKLLASEYMCRSSSVRSVLTRLCVKNRTLGTTKVWRGCLFLDLPLSPRADSRTLHAEFE